MRKQVVLIGALAACACVACSDATDPYAGAIVVQPGEDLAAIVAENAPGSIFLLGAGTHAVQDLEPRDGDQFVGEGEVVVDGGGAEAFAFGNVAGVSRDVVLRNLVITGYRSPYYAAIHGPDTEGWLIEDVEVTGTFREGIATGTGMVIRNSHVHRNGAGGITGDGVSAVRIEATEVAYNGAVGADTVPEFSRGAGIDFGRSSDVVVENSFVHHNTDEGVYMRTDNTGVVIESNRVEDNGGSGILYAVSCNAVIRGNEVRRNGHDSPSWLFGAGIAVLAASSVEVAENVVEDNADGIGGMQVGGWEDGPSCGAFRLEGLDVHDNTIRMAVGLTGIGVDQYDRAFFTSLSNRFRNNTYYLGSGAVYFAWEDLVMDEVEWQAYGNDLGGAFYR